MTDAIGGWVDGDRCGAGIAGKSRMAIAEYVAWIRTENVTLRASCATYACCVCGLRDVMYMWRGVV